MEIRVALAHGRGNGAVRLFGFVCRHAGGGRRHLHLGWISRRGAANAADSAANRLRVYSDWARNQSRARADAHLVAGRSQPGALPGLRLAFRRGNHRHSLRDSPPVSGDAGRAPFSPRSVGDRSRPDLGRRRGVFAAASARLQTHVRLLHRRAHGRHFNGGWPRHVGGRLRRDAANRRSLRDQVVLLLRCRFNAAGLWHARNRRGARVDSQVSRRGRRACSGRIGHHWRAATGDFPERVFDPQSGLDARPLCGDRACWPSSSSLRSLA